MQIPSKAAKTQGLKGILYFKTVKDRIIKKISQFQEQFTISVFFTQPLFLMFSCFLLHPPILMHLHNNWFFDNSSIAASSLRHQQSY